MNIFLIGSLLIILLYFVFYKKESFDNINSATTQLANFLNSDNPSFINYSALLSSLNNTSENLITRKKFNHFLDIKKNRQLTATDIKENM